MASKWWQLRADNEALTRYSERPNLLDVLIKTTLTLLTPANLRTFTDQTPAPAQAYTFAYCFPEVSQMSTQCLSGMNHTYKCSVNSLCCQRRATRSSAEQLRCPLPVWGILGAQLRWSASPWCTRYLLTLSPSCLMSMAKQFNHWFYRLFTS